MHQRNYFPDQHILFVLEQLLAGLLFDQLETMSVDEHRFVRGTDVGNLDRNWMMGPALLTNRTRSEDGLSAVIVERGRGVCCCVRHDVPEPSLERVRVSVL